MPLMSAFLWASDTAEAFISMPITCKIQSGQTILKAKYWKINHANYAN